MDVTIPSSMQKKRRGTHVRAPSHYLQKYGCYVTIIVENYQNKWQRALNPLRPNFGFKAPV